MTFRSGRKSFWGADGKALTPCHECGKVFYCSHACATLDWTAHKQLCGYHTTGQWKPTRPMAEFWIGSSAQAVERELLLHRTKLWPEGGATASIARRGREADGEAAKRAERAAAREARRDLNYRSGQLKI